MSDTGGDVATFATGGYARGLRSKDMMDKIDTDRDGTIKGTLTKEEVMFATGGYNKNS